ncbi:MAG: stage III sporulation protein AF [Sarcina sp.]
MEYLKEFVITLTTISIFIVAVELILPENSLKKYQNFILSLIVLAVMLTPIIKIFNSEKDLTREIHNAIDNEFDVAKESFYEGETSTSFIIQRLEGNCKSLLEEEFKQFKFVVSVDGKVNLETFEIDMKEVNIKTKNKEKSEVESVEKVVIGEGEETEFSKEIKKYLSKELKIDENLINVEEG